MNNPQWLLQPWCNACERAAYGTEGRLWCQDDVWIKGLESSGATSTEYVFPDLASSAICRRTGGVGAAP
jgi:hypothetical protein